MTITHIIRRSQTTPQRRTVNWDELQRRLARSRQTITTSGTELATERFRLLLRQRTQRLAGIVHDKHVEQCTPMLVCRTRAEDYALPLAAIAAVAPLADVTAPPRAPFALIGAMNLHGVIHRIFDLGRMIRGTQETENGGHIIVLRDADYPTGLRVDRAERITAINNVWLGSRQTTSRTSHWTIGSLDGVLILDMAVLTQYFIHLTQHYTA